MQLQGVVLTPAPAAAPLPAAPALQPRKVASRQARARRAREDGGEPAPQIRLGGRGIDRRRPGVGYLVVTAGLPRG